MKKNGYLTFKIFSLIVFTDILESATQVLFKKGTALFPAISLNNLNEYIIFLKYMVTSPWIWMGFLVVTLNFFLWMIVLSKVDLSVAFPVGSASFLFVPLASIFLLHESIGLIRWLGVFLVIIGVILISKSSYD